MNGGEKRQVRRAAARLSSLGRFVAAPRSPEERLRESIQDARNEDVYDAAATCPDCQEVRASTHDVTALCSPHLRRAMGG